MKAKLIALNLLLAAGVGVVIWQARVRVQEAEQVRRAHLGHPLKTVAPPPLSPAPRPETASAIKYEDVAKKDLFSADRNDDIVVEAPKVVAPKPMPPLPVSTGVMKLPSGVKIALAEKPGEMSRFVHVGESIGEFRIAALDSQNVTFEWDGKKIERKIDDLMDRSNEQVASNTNSHAPQGTPAIPPPNSSATPASLGKDLTPSTKACQPGDTSPAGSEAGGYKKEGTLTPFGLANCHWTKQ